MRRELSNAPSRAFEAALGWGGGQEDIGIEPRRRRLCCFVNENIINVRVK